MTGRGVNRREKKKMRRPIRRAATAILAQKAAGVERFVIVGMSGRRKYSYEETAL